MRFHKYAYLILNNLLFLIPFPLFEIKIFGVLNTVTMRFSILWFAIGIAATGQCAAVPKSHVLHEKRDATTSHQWVKREQIPSSAILPMRIGLKQQNLENGHDYLMDM